MGGGQSVAGGLRAVSGSGSAVPSGVLSCSRVCLNTDLQAYCCQAVGCSVPAQDAGRSF